MHVADAFRDRVGAAPDGVWRAPGRVNLIGEHTDYNDGLVLPFAIDRDAVVAVRRRDDRTARVWSLQRDDAVEVSLDEVGPGRCAGWSAYVLGTAWALRRAGVEVPGFDLVVDSAVPVGGGLSSSAALECSTGLALVDLSGASLSPTELAVACRRAENEVVGAPTGVMDQMASVHGRAGHAVFLDCRSMEVEPVPFDPAADGLSVAVVDTKVVHETAGQGYGARRRECAEAAAALGLDSLRDATEDDVRSRLDGLLRHRALHIVTENARVAAVVERLRAGRQRELGELLAASHVSMRDDFEISCPELDTVVETADRAGALGARMTGGGFGGCAVVLWPGEAERLTEAVTAEFARRGFAAPEVFRVVPSAGAARVS